jgi:hypothetical protein
MEPERPILSRDEIVRGLLAGFAGTAAMSLSQRIEMRLSGREPSATPAEALCLLLGFETRTEAEEQRLADEAHWAYGTMWGLGHSMTGSLPEPARTLIYLAAVWSAGTTLLAATRLAPPPTEWKTESLLYDLAHHAIYAGAGSLAYHALKGIAGSDRERDPERLIRELGAVESGLASEPQRSAD